MEETGLFSIGDFAEFARISRDTLLHYDKIGLLSPALRGDNGYRFYSGAQLAVVNVIRTLQQLGMTLDEIRGLKDRRTPKLTVEVLELQVEKIDKRIEEWIRARKLLLTLLRTIKTVESVDENAIMIKYMPSEAIVLGELNDYSRGRSLIETLLSFYSDINSKYPNMDLNYPVWGMISEERIKQGDWLWSDRFYFYNPEGNDRKPSGLYAVGYMRGGYGKGGKLYGRIMDFIDRNGFEVCGNAYEEYPLNEVCITEDDNYLMRVMIAVRERSV